MGASRIIKGVRTEYIAGLVALVFLVGAWFVYPTLLQPTESEDLALVELGDIPSDRVIVDYGLNGDGTVSYNYLGGTVPEKLEENEITELRRENSYTTFVEVVENGGKEKESTVRLSSIVYAQPAFARDVGGSWKYLEYATTTETAMRNRDKTFAKQVREFFVRTAYADTLSPFSGAGDGYVSGTDNALNANLTNCINNAWNDLAGFAADYTSTTFRVYVEMNAFFDDPVFDCTGNAEQGFLPFDSSAIPNATIDSASLNVYVTATTNTDNDGLDYLSVFQSAQATHSQLTSADYGTVGGTEAIDSGQRKDITSISTSAYMTFTLNATGRGFVKTSGQSSSCSATPGITCLGIREGHEIGGSAPGNSTANTVTMSSSEHTGTSQDPYMDINYTVIVSPAGIIRGMGMYPGAPLNINSGGLWLY